jgi:hypothetical protein
MPKHIKNVIAINADNTSQKDVDSISNHTAEGDAETLVKSIKGLMEATSGTNGKKNNFQIQYDSEDNKEMRDQYRHTGGGMQDYYAHIIKRDYQGLEESKFEFNLNDGTKVSVPVTPTNISKLAAVLDQAKIAILSSAGKISSATQAERDELNSGLLKNALVKNFESLISK